MTGISALQSASAPQKQRKQPPRVTIEPLQVPWLQHEQFAAVKAATSAPDALVTSKKSAVAKVGQELKRARTYVDQQLAQLEKELVAISDYLDGSSSSMFPSQILVKMSAAPAIAGGDGANAVAAGGAAAGKGAAAPTDGKLAAASTANALQSAAFLVEDDLASDTPCTTKGLWQYLGAYSYFKPIEPEDMEEALRLEDESPAFGDESFDPDVVEGFGDASASAGAVRTHTEKAMVPGDGKERLPDGPVAVAREQDDFFKERLLAALFPVPSCTSAAPPRENNAEPTLDDVTMRVREDADETRAKQSKGHRVWRRDQDEVAYAASWDPSGITNALREVGLLEMSEREVQRCMKDPEDDQVAQEIRVLQTELRATIRQTNAAKRVLRQMLDRSKPWLSQQEFVNQDNLAKYNALLRRKKELERKKRLKEKKRVRRDVLRVNIASSVTQ